MSEAHVLAHRPVSVRLGQVSLSLQERVDVLLFSSRHYQGMRELLDRLIASQSVICMQGEVGTGKMVLARYIHERSGVSGQLVYVNCKVLGEAQLEAELFGCDGPGSRRCGAFETAHRGTLLIEEIEHMPVRLQARLLRVIERGRPGWASQAGPGGPFSVRLVIGTAGSLPAAVGAGALRRDLYYRIEVAPLLLKPLRARLDDIPALVGFYLLALGNERPVALAPGGLEVLAGHGWSGNMRELESILHRAVVRAQDGIISAELLQQLLRDTPGAQQLETLPVSATYLIRLRDLVREAFAHERAEIHGSVERVLLETAHEYFCGNEADAARALSVSLADYRSARKRHGL